MIKPSTMALCSLLAASTAPISGVASEHEHAPGAVAYELVPATSDAPVTPKVLRDDEHVKMALVTLAAGAQMPEHATPVPVTVQTMSGTGSLTVSGQVYQLAAGSVYFMDANAPHALAASGDTPLVVLVHYLKGGAKAGHDH